MRFTKKVISHCNLRECNRGTVVDQTDRRIEVTDRTLLLGKFGVNSLVCWFLVSFRPREPPLALKMSRKVVAQQFADRLGPRVSLRGSRSIQEMDRESLRSRQDHHHRHLHCHTTGMFSAEQQRESTLNFICFGFAL